MIRVLVAEDSPTARELIVETLRSDGTIQTVGEARDGIEAVALTRTLRPDLVTMDVCMPGLDGLEATRQIMRDAPTPIVIVSATIGREAQASLDALEAGALAVQEKLPGPRERSFSDARTRLLRTVRTMSDVKVVGRRFRYAATPDRGGRPRSAAFGLHRGPSLRVVGVGASTGGPAALAVLVAALPADYPLPIAVVQHMSAGFTAGLAQWLDNHTALEVRLAEDGEPLRSGTIYVAPEDRHLRITRNLRVALGREPQDSVFRPSADVLFDSLAESHGAAALGVILTGMGDDGVVGLGALHRAGGQIIAQDEASSVVFGMPRVAIEAGLADVVAPLTAIGDHLLGAASPGRVHATGGGTR